MVRPKLVETDSEGERERSAAQGSSLAIPVAAVDLCLGLKADRVDAQGGKSRKRLGKHDTEKIRAVWEASKEEFFEALGQTDDHDEVERRFVEDRWALDFDECIRYLLRPKFSEHIKRETKSRRKKDKPKYYSQQEKTEFKNAAIAARKIKEESMQNEVVEAFDVCQAKWESLKIVIANFSLQATPQDLGIIAKHFNTAQTIHNSVSVYYARYLCELELRKAEVLKNLKPTLTDIEENGLKVLAKTALGMVSALPEGSIDIQWARSYLYPSEGDQGEESDEELGPAKKVPRLVSRVAASDPSLIQVQKLPRALRSAGDHIEKKANKMSIVSTEIQRYRHPFPWHATVEEEEEEEHDEEDEEEKLLLAQISDEERSLCATLERLKEVQCKRKLRYEEKKPIFVGAYYDGGEYHRQFDGHTRGSAMLQRIFQAAYVPTQHFSRSAIIITSVSDSKSTSSSSSAAAAAPARKRKFETPTKEKGVLEQSQDHQAGRGGVVVNIDETEKDEQLLASGEEI